MFIKLLLPLVTGASTVLVAVAGAQPSSGQELLDFVTQAHRASRELIRTFSCQVELQVTTKAGKQSCSGKYWSSPEAVRMQVTDDNGRFRESMDYLWKDSIRKSVNRRTSGGDSKVAAGRNPYQNRYLHRCDPARRGLLVHNVPGSGYHPFEQLLQKASRFKRARWTTAGDRKVALVELVIPDGNDRGEEWNVEIYFDPSVNYLIRQVVRTQGNSVYRDEVVQFKECAPGLFFPERIVSRSTDRGEESTTGTTTLSNISVNQPLPADTFDFRYPHGVWLTDGVNNTYYRVDAAGNPISTPMPQGRHGPPPFEVQPLTQSGTETEAEPRSWVRWILPLGLAILVGAVAVAVLRRQRAKADTE